MIDSYSFGRIVIDGKVYTSDVVIFPNRIKSSWWRKEGHRLYVSDIEDVLAERPEVLVVGTGNPGLMRVTDKVREVLSEKGIALIEEPTENAVRTYNQIAKEKRAVAALHLTC
jgi:hypothetical protein